MKINYSKRLKKFERYLSQFSEIKKIKYTGSTKTKSWDKYSDLDIDIYVNKKDFPKFIKKVPKILSWWGEINLIGKYPEGNEIYGYFGKDYLKVEIETIILGENSFSPKKKKKKKIENLSLFLRDWTIYISRHYARGQKFSAFYETFDLRKQIIDYLAEARKSTRWDFIRNAEKNLSNKEKKLIEGITIKNKNLSELKTFILNVWKFLDYIDKIWEKENQKKLNLKINKKGILKMILETLK
jgi:hypothetical protein